MKHRLIRYNIWVCMMVLALFCTGCDGAKQQQGALGGETQAAEVYYEIRETIVPDPDKELVQTLSAEEYIRNLDLLMEDDILYRLAQKAEMVDEVLWGNEYYFQELTTSGTGWETIAVPLDYWGKSYFFDGIIRKEEDKVLCVVSRGVTDPNEEVEQYLGAFDKNGSGELLGKLPENDMQWYVTLDGEMYGYPTLPGGDWVYVDAEFANVRKQQVDGKIYGLYQVPDTKEVYWYGEKTDGYGCWDMETGRPLYQGIQEIAFLEAVAITPLKKAYFADVNGVWEYSPEHPEGTQIIDFFDRYYMPEEIISITANGEDAFSLLVKMDGEYLILQIKKTDRVPPEKQQIVLATYFEDGTTMNDLVVQFNRQSDLYEVVLTYPEKGQDGFAFADSIQMELAAGRGPDLFLNGLISLDSLAQNGYLQSLDGLLKEEEYWDAALECGKVNGSLYGMPYEAYLLSASYSEKLTGGKSRWTLKELMNAVRSSDAEILQQGYNGMDIVIYYGMLDNSNTEFIDWEQGISHLNEETFVEFLQFAYDYADNGAILPEDFGEAIQDGRIAAISGPYTMSHLNYVQECFQEEDSNIGFPREEGNGIYVSANMVFLNSNSKVSEGAKEFLKFITSKGIQLRYAEKNYSGGFFPIHKEAIDKQIELKSLEEESELLAKMNGIYFQHYGFSEEREEVLKFFFKHSQPGVWKADPLLGIFTEELEPFFAGDCTAQEAADKLHSRIQLYLDENF